MPGTLAALEQGRITLAKTRIVDAETLNLSPEHTAAVEQQALAKARQQTPGQLRAATRRAMLTTDPSAARKRTERAARERGVQMWPEPDGMAQMPAHYQVKQAPGWSVTQHPDGCTTWVTPSGHQYHSQPPPLTDPEPLTMHPAADPDQPPPF